MTKAFRIAATGFALVAASTVGMPAATAHGAPKHGGSDPNSCAPRATALGYSDALDKLSVGGVTVGGLSDLAYDRRSHAWASTATTTAAIRRASGSSATSRTRR